jgi:GMP synthase (glutamine-hydrolysing)
MQTAPVLCICNDPDDTLGITIDALQANGLEVLKLDALTARAALPSLEEIAALIVFGGAMNVDEVERYPVLQGERQLMRRAVDSGMPVLGICLGAQMLARALDARVYRSPVRELGFKPVALTEAGRNDALLAGFGDGPHVFQWHEDTFDLPAGAVQLARGDDVALQAFRSGDRAWGVQFHFEVDAAVVDAWLRAAGDRVRRDWNREPDDVRGEVRRYLKDQEARSRLLFAAFATQIKQRRLRDGSRAGQRDGEPR